jgi:ketosteroid isomerase-like protein
MPAANLDLVRSIYAPWERGDFSIAEWADPEIEFVLADGPAPDSTRGLAGMATSIREVLSVWEDVRIVADEYRELDDERVLVLAHRSGRGKGSGVQLGGLLTKGLFLFHIRGGKVTRLVFYWDRERGLADLGLAPHTG